MRFKHSPDLRYSCIRQCVMQKTVIACTWSWLWVALCVVAAAHAERSRNLLQQKGTVSASSVSANVTHVVAGVASFKSVSLLVCPSSPARSAGANVEAAETAVEAENHTSIHNFFPMTCSTTVGVPCRSERHNQRNNSKMILGYEWAHGKKQPVSTADATQCGFLRLTCSRAQKQCVRAPTVYQLTSPKGTPCKTLPLEHGHSRYLSFPDRCKWLLSCMFERSLNCCGSQAI
jgi:hypothetical protein